MAVPLIIGGLIAHNNQGHSDHQSTDRRIDVSPRTLTVNGDGSDVTITNVGRDDVTIKSITISGQSANLFGYQGQCGKLAAGQACRISLTAHDHSGVRATLVIDSNGGRATVSLVAPNYSDLK